MSRALPLFSILALLPIGPAAAQVSTADRYAALREAMVRDYVEREGVSNERVLQAMRTVPRHEFVPPKERTKAYFDGALPIGHKQTISPPFIVAYMTETIDPRADETVLEIGTGSGYQAAVLSELCKQVYTIEIVDQLGRTARSRLKRLGYDNVEARVGDGYKGWAEHAPFDKIIVTCSPEKVPQPLVDQLAEGGKLIVPLGRRYQQVFHLFEKRDGKLVATKLIPTLFVPMTGIAEDNRVVQPDPANPTIFNGGFEADANEDGRADGWHYQRQTSLVTDGSPEGKTHVSMSNDELGRPAQMLQGMALDGRKVKGIRLSAMVRFDITRPGLAQHERPAVVIHYYDTIRRPIGEEVIGPFVGASEWTRMARTLRIPPTTREAVVRVGLNGATGQLDVDDVTLEVIGP